LDKAIAKDEEQKKKEEKKLRKKIDLFNYMLRKHDPKLTSETTYDQVEQLLTILADAYIWKDCSKFEKKRRIFCDWR
jgi:pre-mRNA-processing factor 40